MFGCFRKGEANDPETYVAAVAVTLAQFSRETIERVTHPLTGIPSFSKWLPNISELREACDNAQKYLAHERKVKAMGWDWNGEKWEKGEV